MKIKTFLIPIILSIITNWTNAQNIRNDKYIIITDFIKNDGKKDVSNAIQKVIDDNPNRTIYFPDGTYIIDKPIITPADPSKSVALQLSNYAIIRAGKNWNNEEAMIRLGGKDAANNITIPGSNYYFDGGIIDGNSIAKGISIDSGRETVIRNTSIKNVSLGIHVKYGVNSGSSDADIHNVNIVGNFKPDCIGVLVDGFDNTFTNMRIGGVHVGFKIRSEANCLRNIHPLYYSSGEQYETSCGFIDERQNNWYDFCYSDEFAVAFYINGGKSFYNNCFAYWYSKRGKKHTVFKSDGDFNSNVINMNVGFNKNNATTENIILESTLTNGTGIFSYLNICDNSVVTNSSHTKYIK